MTTSGDYSQYSACQGLKSFAPSTSDGDGFLKPAGGILASRTDVETLNRDAPLPKVNIVLLSLVGTRPGKGPSLDSRRARKQWTACNRANAPGLEVFPSVNGFNKTATLLALNESGLRFHKISLPKFGMLANALTKFFAMRQQIERQVPSAAPCHARIARTGLYCIHCIPSPRDPRCLSRSSSRTICF